MNAYPGARLYGAPTLLSRNIACWRLPGLLAACWRPHGFLGRDLSDRDPISAASYDRLFSTRCRGVELPGPGRLPSICPGYPGLRSDLGREVRVRRRFSYDWWRLSPSRRVPLEFLVTTIEACPVLPRLRLPSKHDSRSDQSSCAESQAPDRVRFRPNAVRGTKAIG
jgi:hypothetical protein